MKKKLIFILLLSSAKAFSASYNCEAPKLTTIEKMICADKSLSKLDEELASIYKVSRSKIKDTQQLRVEQLNWLRNTRNECFYIECLQDAYTSRIDELNKLAGITPPTVSTSTVMSNQKRLAENFTKASTLQHELSALKETSEPADKPFSTRRDFNACIENGAFDKITCSQKLVELSINIDIDASNNRVVLSLLQKNRVHESDIVKATLKESKKLWIEYAKNTCAETHSQEYDRNLCIAELSLKRGRYILQYDDYDSIFTAAEIKRLNDFKKSEPLYDLLMKHKLTKDMLATIKLEKRLDENNYIKNPKTRNEFYYNASNCSIDETKLQSDCIPLYKKSASMGNIHSIKYYIDSMFYLGKASYKEKLLEMAENLKYQTGDVYFAQELFDKINSIPEYKAYIACSLNGKTHQTLACFKESSLRITKNNTTKLYNIYNIQQAGPQYYEGIEILLPKSFSIETQNSQKHAILSVKIFDENKQVIYENQAGLWDTIKISN